MLMGATQPTSGTVVAGSATQHLRYGVCLQQDILWPQLTALDHLQLFAGLQGLRGDEARRAVTGSITTWGIGDGMLRQPVAQLSGGQKRKLCIALAWLGDPDVVILDEPTAGKRGARVGGRCSRGSMIPVTGPRSSANPEQAWTPKPAERRG